jgi:hypothetical protein
LAGSLRRHARELDHLAPFLRVVGGEFAEFVGLMGIGTPPPSAMRAFTCGSASPAFTALLRAATTCGGVFLGAKTPYQMLTS